jgi:hypothetical protein
MYIDDISQVLSSIQAGSVSPTITQIAIQATVSMLGYHNERMWTSANKFCFCQNGCIPVHAQ